MGEKMARKKKVEKVDGFGPYEKNRVRQAVRKVWHQSRARALVVKRCRDDEGYFVCEICLSRAPHGSIDHIEPVGEVDDEFLKRMFVSSDFLQGLCKKCHREKTNRQRKQKKEKTKK